MCELKQKVFPSNFSMECDGFFNSLYSPQQKYSIIDASATKKKQINPIGFGKHLTTPTTRN
jgi:hypothetical protein